MDRVQLRQDLYDAFANYLHQMLYPEMSADYYHKMRTRLITDSIFRARVDYITSNVMLMLDKSGAEWDHPEEKT